MSDLLSLSERAQQAHRLIDAALGSERRCARIDELVRSAAATLDVDSASLSMLSDRQVTLSTCSPAGSGAMAPARGTQAAFEDSMCATALRVDEALVIPDTHADARVSSVPVVRAGLVGSYLGAPLRRDGAIVGVLCAATTRPRQWQDTDLEVLERIARDILAELVRDPGA